MTTYVAETFEMLWDCPACGSTKLLGVKHRYCPGCGHPQDHDRRYFPKEGERVPTAYRGCAADKVCPACSTACGASDANCFGCGSPLAGAKQVHVRRSIVDGAGETGAKADHEARKADRRLTSSTGVRTDGHKVSGVVPMSPTWVRDQVIDHAPTQSEPISRVTLADLCVYCGIHRDECERHMHFDHLDPRSEGGEDVATNLVLACEPCNSARKTMTLRQWKAYAAVKRGLVIDLRKVRAQARKALPN